MVCLQFFYLDKSTVCTWSYFLIWVNGRAWYICIVIYVSSQPPATFCHISCLFPYYHMLNNHDSSYCEKVGNCCCLWLLAADQEQLTPDKDNYNPSLYPGKNHEAFVNAFWYVMYAYNTHNANCWQSVEEWTDLNQHNIKISVIISWTIFCKIENKRLVPLPCKNYYLN